MDFRSDTVKKSHILELYNFLFTFNVVFNNPHNQLNIIKKLLESIDACYNAIIDHFHSDTCAQTLHIMNHYVTSTEFMKNYRIIADIFQIISKKKIEFLARCSYEHAQWNRDIIIIKDNNSKELMVFKFVNGFNFKGKSILIAIPDMYLLHRRMFKFFDKCFLSVTRCSNAFLYMTNLNTAQFYNCSMHISIFIVYFYYSESIPLITKFLYSKFIDSSSERSKRNLLMKIMEKKRQYDKNETGMIKTTNQIIEYNYRRPYYFNNLINFYGTFKLNPISRNRRLSPEMIRFVVSLIKRNTACGISMIDINDISNIII
ncbi:MAG: hypothetical protein KDH96_07565 [Candidatus Riesia sp.]|nr:hypothetical protein [Candidatus Riesia sp.]